MSDGVSVAKCFNHVFWKTGFIVVFLESRTDAIVGSQTRANVEQRRRSVFEKDDTVDTQRLGPNGRRVSAKSSTDGGDLDEKSEARPYAKLIPA